MVSEQTVTETVWTEVERNLFVNPRPANLTGFVPTGATQAIADGGITLTSTVSTGLNTARLNWNAAGLRPSVTPGEPVTISVDICSPQLRSASLSMLFYDASGVYITGSIVSSPAYPNAAEFQRRTFAPIAPANAVTVAFYFANGGTIAVGDKITFRNIRFGAGDYFDGDTPSSDTVRYRWLGPSDASISVKETGEIITSQFSVFEVVTLTTTTDEIVFYAEPNATGFVYDNETLQRWYNPAKIVANVDKRPNAHGAYGLGQLFTEEHRPLITGQYYGTSSIDAKRARERLVSAFSEGFPVSIAVTDEEGVTTRRAAWLVDYDAPFDADFAHFTFDIEFIAPDPRRYGATESSSTGLPTPGSGLVWNLGTAPSGLYFDWGTAGSLGQLSVTNGGGAATNPRIEVGGAGAFLAGFRVTEIETGRELILERPTDFGDVVVLDSRTQRATLNGGDISRFLVSRDWFEIPAGATRRYQINPLGATSGAPTMTIYTASASL